MPKCLNDSKKTYTGKEPSPKGLGYSASCEEKDKKMVGKDGNMYIVTETKTCKKWMKLKKEDTTIEIDFDNLSEEFYTEVYIPKTIEIKFEEETGIEEKFGGSKPFFINGQSWPIDDDGIPMRFFCQFKDKKKSDNYLYRVFLSIDNENDVLGSYFIDKIELNEENIKNQIIIEKPIIDEDNNNDNDSDNNNDNLSKIFKPFKIKYWTETKELKSYKYILTHFNISGRFR